MKEYERVGGWEGGRAAIQCHFLVMVPPGPSGIVVQPS